MVFSVAAAACEPLDEGVDDGAIASTSAALVSRYPFLNVSLPPSASLAVSSRGGLWQPSCYAQGELDKEYRLFVSQPIEDEILGALAAGGSAVIKAKARRRLEGDGILSFYGFTTFHVDTSSIGSGFVDDAYSPGAAAAAVAYATRHELTAGDFPASMLSVDLHASGTAFLPFAECAAIIPAAAGSVTWEVVSVDLVITTP